MIKPWDIERKYTRELHANEIVLLAYYIASVNIESAFYEQQCFAEEPAMGGIYHPFEGICLTDTFQLGETGADDVLIAEMFPQNTKRVNRQKKAPLRVIIGNPPYSVGQSSANDNAQNQKYPKLDTRIADTYARGSNATLKNSLYDSYIRAFRWSSDRLDPKNGGIIAFVSNGAWLDSNSSDGFRKCLEREFSSIYVFNLRGNQRTSGELSRKEGGKIFGSGSRTPIAITFLVKNPDVPTDKATIYYHDIGDYLSRDQKLDVIGNFRSALSSQMQWEILQPNEHGDWISVRNEGFEKFIPLGDKDERNNRQVFFLPCFTNGVKTNRDVWVYNYSSKALGENINGMIRSYNDSVDALKLATDLNEDLDIEDFIDKDPKKINWTVNLRSDFVRGRKHAYNEKFKSVCLYRPFSRQVIYFDRAFIERPGMTYNLFKGNNLLICVAGIGGTKAHSAIVVDVFPDYELIGKSQCFPLYYYEENNVSVPQIDFSSTGNENKYTRKDAISDFILKQAQSQYGINVTKEDIFYYVYGFLHSPEYRTIFEADLKKMLPRLPLVDKVDDFWAFSKAGRKLADLHLNYENVPPYPDAKVEVLGEVTGSTYLVDKMRFPKKGKLDTIIYNSRITVSDIPDKAYEYQINGKSAIEWIMERYQITIHKDSQIKNDPNDWAREHNQPRYILDLLLSVINVSVQTVDIVNSLPKLDFSEL